MHIRCAITSHRVPGALSNRMHAPSHNAYNTHATIQESKYDFLANRFRYANTPTTTTVLNNASTNAERNHSGSNVSLNSCISSGINISCRTGR
jgi:hypothetical protein